MRLIVQKTISNLKFPAVLVHRGAIYCFGIESVAVDDCLNRFVLVMDVYDSGFNFVERRGIGRDFTNSSLIWDISEVDDCFVFLFEEKSIDVKEHTSQFYKLFVTKDDVTKFHIYKTEMISNGKLLVSKTINGYLLSSEIEQDEERPDYYWGKYLFRFKDPSGEFYRPEFDGIVDYEKDKGHIIHFVEFLKEQQQYRVVFSIRRKHPDDKNKYYYTICASTTTDLVRFSNTHQVTIDNSLTNSTWYCYPSVFKTGNGYLALLNQDDFGKEKDTLVAEVRF
jgi:hypothetical protein